MLATMEAEAVVAGLLSNIQQQHSQAIILREAAQGARMRTGAAQARSM